MIPERITETGLVTVGKGVCGGAILIAGTGAGWSNAYLRLYDNATEASGTTLCELATMAEDSKPFDSIRIPYKNGIWGVITGTGASAIVYKD